MCRRGSTFWLWIERLAGRGIIGGYPCGGPVEPCVAPANRPYFRPNNNVTRGQLAKIVSRRGGLDRNADRPDLRGCAAGQHLLSLRGAGRQPRASSAATPAAAPASRASRPATAPYFRPNNNATRGQMSKIAANAFFPDCATPARP